MNTNSPNDSSGGFLRVLRAAALIATMLGAVGSVALMFRVGHRNPSILLMVLFTGWVLAPFVGLMVAERRSKRWSAVIGTTLHGVMLVVALTSVAIYGNIAFGPPRAQPAFWFLVVPAASWLPVGIVVMIAPMVSRRQPRGSDRA